VSEAKRDGRIFRFGLFELDGESGELRKEGREQPRIRDQGLRILLLLLERPRELVSREELRERLWASDTFVDFDHGLNTAINQLRTALGDSSANPRFIQTLPRRGYRFIAPVESGAAPLAAETDGAREDRILSSRAAVLSAAAELPAVPRKIVRVLFAAIQLMYLSFYALSLAYLPRVQAVLAALGDPVRLVLALLILTAAAGIPIRLYLLSATAFNYRGLHRSFLKLFPLLLPLDELWALAPFLLAPKIGIGAAIAATAALLYLPFSQRSLLLMGFASRAA
jgi:DNA-binding winged helix-turn-helix (wHTH) protein